MESYSFTAQDSAGKKVTSQVRAADQKAAAELGDTGNKHKAAKHVAENRAAYGLPVTPFRGWCGLAGKP